MKKNSKRGFTLMEMLVTVGVIAILSIGISTGISAAMRAYKQSVFTSECSSLSDILNATIGDILRYSEVDMAGSENEFTLTNYDYNVRNASFGLKNDEGGIDSGYIVLTYKTNKDAPEKDMYIVNKGAYADHLKVTSLHIDSIDAQNSRENKYLFDVKYTIQDTKTGSENEYSFRVRQANADVEVVYGKEKDNHEDEEEIIADSDYITVVYDSNVPKDINPFVIETFWGYAKTFIQMDDPKVSKNIHVIGDEDIYCDWYTITKWTTEKGGGGNSYTPGEDCTLKMSDVKDGVLELYAQWELTEYKIVYRCEDGNETDTVNGGTFTKDSSAVTLSDNSDGAIKSPVGSEVTFNGNSGKVNSKSKYSENALSPLLKWKTVSEDGNSTEYSLGQTIDATTVKEFKPSAKDATLYIYPVWGDACVTTPTASKDNWTFDGWSESPYAASNLTQSGKKVNISNKVTYYAQYSTTVLFKNNEAGTQKVEKTVHYGNDFIWAALCPTNSEITKTGYHLDDYYTEEGGNGDRISKDAIEADNLTYIANWLPNPYYVQFDGNGATGGSMGKQGFTYDEPQGLAENGFTRSYTVTFDPKNGKFADGSSSNKAITESWSFNGWATSASENVKYADMASVNNLTAEEEGTFRLYAKWTANNITLPTVTRSNWTFNGWYDGSTPYAAGAAHSFGANKTLNAKWKCTVTYDYDAAGTNESVTFNDGDTSLKQPSVPTPSKSGYRFYGWYAVISGSINTSYPLSAAVSRVTANGNTTYKALFKPDRTIYISTKNGARTADSSFIYDGITGAQIDKFAEVSSRTAHADDLCHMKIHDAHGVEDYSVTAANGQPITVKVTRGKLGDEYMEIEFTMPDCDVTLYIEGDTCVAGDTLVTMADGTQKPIKDVNVGDMVMTWSFEKGCYEPAPVGIKWYHGTDRFIVLYLNFSDSSTVKVINAHGFFDKELNTYVYIDWQNYSDYLGHHFPTYNADGTAGWAVLESVEVKSEVTGCYSLLTAFNTNFVTEGIMSVTNEPLEGYFEAFEFDGLKYDEAKKAADIEKYGLYTYEEFSDYLTEEQFYAFNLPYHKAYVGKGVITYTDILYMIENYVNSPTC